MNRFDGVLLLNDLLELLGSDFESYELVAHWTQGEFHHDLVFRCSGPRSAALPGDHLVASTNCNGGVKEIIVLAGPPDRLALWHGRCPDNPEFDGTPPEVLASYRTVHWFDPCELLVEEARSELRPECRVRQPGGGWMAAPSAKAR